MIIKQSEIDDAIHEACWDADITINGKFSVIEYGGITWHVRKTRIFSKSFKPGSVKGLNMNFGEHSIFTERQKYLSKLHEKFIDGIISFEKYCSNLNHNP